MPPKKMIVSQPSGSAAGGADRFLRRNDWYNTSEIAQDPIFQPEEHMCYISTLENMRDVIFIAPKPDPNAVFSMKLRGPLQAESSVGVGAAASPELFYSTETRLFLDKSKLPLVIKSFAADGKSAVCTTSIIGSYADETFQVPVPENERENKTAVGPNDPVPMRADCHYIAAHDRNGKPLPKKADGTPSMMPVVYYPCRFQRFALSPNCYGGTMGAISLKRRSGDVIEASGVLTYFFPKNTFGEFPRQTMLRMQVRVTDGERERWLDYIPENPIQGSDAEPACDEFGRVRYMIPELMLGAKYDAWVEDITAWPYDGGSRAERKRNIKTLIADQVYFAQLRRYNPGNKIVRDALCIPDLTLEDTRIQATATEDQARKNAAIYFWNASILDQPIHKTLFYTPVPSSDRNRDITFAAGSCFAGTLDAFQGLHLLDHMFLVLLGDKMYNDNCRGPIADFMGNYAAWLKNTNGQRAIQSSSLYVVSDDHENADNWFRNIAINAFNSVRYIMTPEQKALLQLMMANPGIAARIPFKSANQYSSYLSNVDRIRNSFLANRMFWPAEPFNIEEEHRSPNGSFMVRWGSMNLIMLQSNATLHSDGSVTYDAVEGTVSPDGSTFTRPPGAGYAYIPSESVLFLKRMLKDNPAGAHAVMFSSDVSMIFQDRFQFLKEDFVAHAAMAYAAAAATGGSGASASSCPPNAASSTPSGGATAAFDAALAEELYDKLFNSNNFDSADGYHPQISELIAWIKSRNPQTHKKPISNVFFFTGDPHSTLVRYLDKENVIVSACLSSVSTYRASGANLTLASNLQEDDTIMSESNNCFGCMKYSPSKDTMTIELRFGAEIRDAAVIPLKPAPMNLTPASSASVVASAPKGSWWPSY